MSRWFRWYGGTCEDGKFRAAARNARVTVRDVISVWAVILEDASSDKHRGVCTRDEAFIASILDFDGDEVSRILVEMQSLDMVAVTDGKIAVVNWALRQFESDVKDPTNRDRQKRWRDRNKTVIKHQRNGTVTVDETETKRPDTEQKQIITRAKARADEHPDFDEWYRSYPRREARGAAEKAYRAARKSTEASVLLDGVKKAIARYSGSDPQFIPLPATWLNQKRWLDDPPAPAVKAMTSAERYTRETGIL